MKSELDASSQIIRICVNDTETGKVFKNRFNKDTLVQSGFNQNQTVMQIKQVIDSAMSGNEQMTCQIGFAKGMSLTNWMGYKGEGEGEEIELENMESIQIKDRFTEGNDLIFRITYSLFGLIYTLQLSYVEITESEKITTVVEDLKIEMQKREERIMEEFKILKGDIQNRESRIKMEINRANRDVINTVEKQKTNLQSEIKAMKREMRNEIERLKESHKKEIVSLKQAKIQEMQVLKDEIQRLRINFTKEFEEIKHKMNSKISTPIPVHKSQIQESKEKEEEKNKKQSKNNIKKKKKWKLNIFGSNSENTRENIEEIPDTPVSDKTQKKILLLGTGYSGTSTLFKQFKIIYGDGFKEDRRNYQSHIYGQVIEAIKMMIYRAEDIVDDGGANADDYKISSESETAAEFILGTRSNAEMTEEIARNLSLLWNDPAIKRVYEMRAKISIASSTEYFMNKLDDIKSKDYIPTDKDILLVRHFTTGMAERTFKINGHNFRIVDAGGTRNERRKWIHFFDSVTAVLFVASLSSYNESPFVDEDANSMLESLEVFKENVNSEWFEHTAFILLLNKRDIFMEKIKTIPLTIAFPEYTGENTALEYIQKKFESLNSKPNEREIYTQIINATDTQDMARLFNDIQHIVTDWSLTQSALI